MIAASVDAPQITEQMRKLEQFGAIAREEYTGTMRLVITLSKADQSARAPVESGALAGSVGGEIRYAVGDEVRAVMTASARAPDGFPYGYALNVSDRYHYRGRRRKTKRWFSGVIGRQRKVILALFAQATERIVKRLEVNPGGGE